MSKRKKVNCDDCFESPFHCPEQIPTRRFTSPNSPLKPKELEELQRCIEKANHLLRSLGSDSDPNNMRQLQLQFLELQGTLVKVKISCNSIDSDDAPTVEIKDDLDKGVANPILQKGILATAGRDFLQVNSTGKFVFILYDKLVSITREEHDSKSSDQEFIDADCSTKRDLVLNFGEFVSNRPEIINLFFGLSLHKQLLKYLGKDVSVRNSDSQSILTGTLTKANEGSIQITNSDGSADVNLDQICFLEVLNMK
ncbi:hypothetical protein D8M04_13175 [Oceanobacillus piezotolerans]|uniref:Uncharacterized protein n=1 Tax=Oceanobacillus piezotolerans TaxID=2448030 RepID=A0A498D4P5_9BACI|nr:hypothetical protein [Oceanobacillus piezotolerans]RLL43855.1 hypothetical protein D8M04_13175 [Oceanobacillus piezotolerans]